jgi:hypothetical protein
MKLEEGAGPKLYVLFILHNKVAKWNHLHILKMKLLNKFKKM